MVGRLPEDGLAAAGRLPLMLLEDDLRAGAAGLLLDRLPASPPKELSLRSFAENGGGPGARLRPELLIGGI